MNITDQINKTALRELKKHPEGLRWKDLFALVLASNENFHPKTVNSCIWKFPTKFPDKVYKPEKGIFKLISRQEHK